MAESEVYESMGPVNNARMHSLLKSQNMLLNEKIK